jgi:hypothetical protein
MEVVYSVLSNPVFKSTLVRLGVALFAATVIRLSVIRGE